MLPFVTAWCGAVPLGPGIVAGLLLAGAAGSSLHCVPMCGGFVLAQVADRMARLPAPALCEWRRVRTGLLLPYHLGRLTTYAALGASAGATGAVLGRVVWFGWLSAALLMLGALLFLLQAARRIVPGLIRLVPGLELAPSAWGRWLGRATRRLDRDRRLSGYVLGLVLGFLPCGFLYAALAASAATANPLLGAAAMLAFGVGTVPALVVTGIAGQAAAHHFRRGVAAIAPSVMVLNAVLMMVLAVRGLS